MSGSGLDKELLKHAGFQGGLDCLKQIWPPSSLRKSPGRASQALFEAAAQETSNALLPIVGDNWAPLSGAELVASAAAGLFVAAGGRDSAYLERDGLANLRIRPPRGGSG